MLVFVYGTLTEPDRVDAVVDDWSFAGEAVLEGLVRVDGRYPTLVPPGFDEGGRAAEGATAEEGAGTEEGVGPEEGATVNERAAVGEAGSHGVQGRLLRTPEVDALDAYEGVDRGLYVRVRVPVADRPADAAVYVGDPSRLGSDGAWPGRGPPAERVRQYVGGADVIVRLVGGS